MIVHYGYEKGFLCEAVTVNFETKISEHLDGLITCDKCKETVKTLRIGKEPYRKEMINFSDGSKGYGIGWWAEENGVRIS